MLADYVMKNIDSIFSEKLKGREPTHRPKNAATFDKELIRKSLHKVIRKDLPPETSPLPRPEASPSPLSKSKLRVFLQSNREEKIKSVLRSRGVG